MKLRLNFVQFWLVKGSHVTILKNRLDWTELSWYVCINACLGITGTELLMGKAAFWEFNFLLEILYG